jgi:hypothetical protein
MRRDFFGRGKVRRLLSFFSLFVVWELSMDRISNERNKLADFWHKSTMRSKFSPIKFFGSDDAYASFYTAKYLIQDTSEALFTHMRRGFSSDPMQQYIEVWGVFQAVIIQQDSIVELHCVLTESPPDTTLCENWLQLRQLRNTCAGHPVNASKGARRSFFGKRPAVLQRFLI